MLCYYQRMQSGLPVFLVDEFGTCKIFMEACVAEPDFSSFYKHKKYVIFGENMIISSYWLITNQLLRFWFIYKAQKVGIVKKETPLITPSFSFFHK